MAELKFYFDTHISKAVAVQLRLRGVDVVRCEEIGMAEADDLDHLLLAISQERALVSMDADFLDWHDQWLMEGKSHNGIFRVQPYLQGDNGIGAIVKSLLEYAELIRQGAGTLEADIANRVTFVG